MGYSTSFTGKFSLDRPLESHHKEYLLMFSDSRRMKRDPEKVMQLPDSIRNHRCMELLNLCNLPIGNEGDFYCGIGMCGQDRDNSVIDYNREPSNQPGLWCQWVPDDSGENIVWDQGEKFYEYESWLEYIINKFLKPWGYILNGSVEWQGEESHDMGLLEVTNNVVNTKIGEVVYR